MTLRRKTLFHHFHHRPLETREERKNERKKERESKIMNKKVNVEEVIERRKEYRSKRVGESTNRIPKTKVAS